MEEKHVGHHYHPFLLARDGWADWHPHDSGLAAVRACRDGMAAERAWESDYSQLVTTRAQYCRTYEADSDARNVLRLLLCWKHCWATFILAARSAKVNCHVLFM